MLKPWLVCPMSDCMSNTPLIQSRCWTSLLTIVNKPCGSLTALPMPSMQFLQVCTSWLLELDLQLSPCFSALFHSVFCLLDVWMMKEARDVVKGILLDQKGSNMQIPRSLHEVSALTLTLQCLEFARTKQSNVFTGVSRSGLAPVGDGSFEPKNPRFRFVSDPTCAQHLSGSQLLLSFHRRHATVCAFTYLSYIM